MSSPNLPNIDNIPPSALLSVSRGTIMDNYGYLSGAASTTAAGLIELADQSEVSVGLDDCRAITPSGLITYVEANSAGWGDHPDSFVELSDVNATTFVSGDIGTIPTVTEVSAGYFALTMETNTVSVDNSNVCLNHDLASSDTNFLLPALVANENCSVAIIKQGTGTTVTLSPSGGDTIQGQTSAFISNNTDDVYSNIFLRGIGFNWTIMFGAGEWRQILSSEILPVTDVLATPRYCNDTTVSASVSLNERSYVTEEYANGSITYYSCGTWTPRQINTISDDPLNLIQNSEANVDSTDSFQLNPGKYRVNIEVTYQHHEENGSDNQYQFRLRDITSSQTKILSNIYSSESHSGATHRENLNVTFSGSFTLTELSYLQLQHFTATPKNQVHNISANASGEKMKIANIEIEKIS